MINFPRYNPDEYWIRGSLTCGRLVKRAISFMLEDAPTPVAK